jgi:hypothetical protein
MLESMGRADDEDHSCSREHVSRPRRPILIVLTPALIAAVSSSLVLLLAALGAPSSEVELGIFGIYAGWAAALIGVVLLLLLPVEGRVLWLVLMVSLLLVSSAVSLGVWAGALSIACHGGSSCVFG